MPPVPVPAPNTGCCKSRCGAVLGGGEMMAVVLVVEPGASWLALDMAGAFCAEAAPHHASLISSAPPARR